MRAWILAMATLAGCGGGAPASNDPAPPAHGYQIKTPDIQLMGGQEEYLCYTVKLDEAADVAVNQFQGYTTTVVHHFEVFQAIAPEQDGLFDCSQQLIKITWLPLFGGGAQAGGLTLPDGAGFKIPKNAQLLVQLHLLNATTAPASTHVVVNMDYVNDPTTVTPAGIFAVGSMNIDLLPNSTGTKVSSSCNLPKPLNVFAVQPHMHTLGTSITLDSGATQAASAMAYQRNPWVFGVQPIDTFTKTFAKGDYVNVDCVYDNTTPNEVMYGESTHDEMCYFVLFYTPFDQLDGCIN